MEQLYLVVFLEGCLGALFDAAYPAYVPVAHRRRPRRRGQQQAGHELVPGRDRRSGPGGRARPAHRRAVRDPGRRDLVRRLGDLAGPDPQPGAAAAGEDRRRRRSAHEILEGLRLVRRHPVLVPLDPSLGHRPRRRLVLRRPVHDLPHPGPAPQPVPARRSSSRPAASAPSSARSSPRGSSRRFGFGPALIWTADRRRRSSAC